MAGDTTRRRIRVRPGSAALLPRARAARWHRRRSREFEDGSSADPPPARGDAAAQGIARGGRAADVPEPRERLHRGPARAGAPPGRGARRAGRRPPGHHRRHPRRPDAGRGDRRAGLVAERRQARLAVPGPRLPHEPPRDHPGHAPLPGERAGQGRRPGDGRADRRRVRGGDVRRHRRDARAPDRGRGDREGPRAAHRRDLGGAAAYPRGDGRLAGVRRLHLARRADLQALRGRQRARGQPGAVPPRARGLGDRLQDRRRDRAGGRHRPRRPRAPPGGGTARPGRGGGRRPHAAPRAGTARDGGRTARRRRRRPGRGGRGAAGNGRPRDGTAGGHHAPPPRAGPVRPGGVRTRLPLGRARRGRGGRAGGAGLRGRRLGHRVRLAGVETRVDPRPGAGGRGADGADRPGEHPHRRPGDGEDAYPTRSAHACAGETPAPAPRRADRPRGQADAGGDRARRGDAPPHPGAAPGRQGRARRGQPARRRPRGGRRGLDARRPARQPAGEGGRRGLPPPARRRPRPAAERRGGGRAGRPAAGGALPGHPAHAHLPPGGRLGDRRQRESDQRRAAAPLQRRHPGLLLPRGGGPSGGRGDRSRGRRPAAPRALRPRHGRQSRCWPRCTAATPGSGR